MAKLLEDADIEIKSFQRRDLLRDNELRVQKIWDAQKTFEADACDTDAEDYNGKYFATFPYPYMNGVLHVGHAFTISKAEFAVGFQKLLGKKILFPFGFHCTGMPIAAAAKKIRNEIELFGNPPQFPGENEEDVEPESTSAPSGKKSKGKAAKKKSKMKYQWQILEEMKTPPELIHRFADPEFWLEYFPPIAVDHLKEFGLKVDWRRSFITTSRNPYYDAFIRWQFNTLRKLDLIDFGKRISIFSPLDNQACADHARASGEGVGPQEYTGIKMELVGAFPDVLSHLQGKKIFLVAATLRPETMYGQTNCWILPRGEYGAFEMKNGEIFICSERAALNLAYQEFTETFGEVKKLASLEGWDLLGKTVKAPNATFDTIFVLPLLTISMSKGTGIVTSVPSDAPDDFVALQDLKKDESLCKKYYISPEMIEPFEPVPIIDIPELGNMAAPKLCTKLKVKNQHDRAKLDQAKEQCYKQGFFKGTMAIGPHSGMPVKDAKTIIQNEMIEAGQAFVYSEPESVVVSRSGDECVCALTDQWYMKYGQPDWQEKVRNHVSHVLETFNPTAKEKFLGIVEWLHEWACSRSFGLGTQLPWDPQFVIESLSDSTIYMAYYTIAHFLQEGSLEGSVVGSAGIPASLLNDEIFDYIFLQAPFPSECGVAEDTLKMMKKEFEFWYPLDLRVSGKDLIGNHLTMSLYNHSAIWKDPKMWPRSFFTNGHSMLNDKKMSKSEGNFMTLKEAIDMFGSDATRFALADAGDGLEDANFTVKTANAAILRLTKELEWISETLATEDCFRDSESGSSDAFLDTVFINDMRKAIQQTKRAFANMEFRTGLKTGVYELQNDRNFYRASVQQGYHKDIVRQYIEVSAILISPICPHWAQKVWEDLGKPGLIVDARWPVEEEVDSQLSVVADYMKNLARELRLGFISQTGSKKFKTPPTTAYIYIAESYPDWQAAVLTSLKSFYEEHNALPEKSEVMKLLKPCISNKKVFGQAMAFAHATQTQFSVQGPSVLNLDLGFNELEIVKKYLDIICRGLDISEFKVYSIDEADVPDPCKKKSAALPGFPSFCFQ